VLRFKWIEWNLDKIDKHALSADEVEYAFSHPISLHEERSDGSYETVGKTQSGRPIVIVWRFDEEFDALTENYVVQVVFVISAY
jgi:hypothetical protein